MEKWDMPFFTIFSFTNILNILIVLSHYGIGEIHSLKSDQKSEGSTLKFK